MYANRCIKLNFQTLQHCNSVRHQEKSYYQQISTRPDWTMYTKANEMERWKQNSKYTILKLCKVKFIGITNGNTKYTTIFIHSSHLQSNTTFTSHPFDILNQYPEMLKLDGILVTRYFHTNLQCYIRHHTSKVWHDTTSSKHHLGKEAAVLPLRHLWYITNRWLIIHFLHANTCAHLVQH